MNVVANTRSEWKSNSLKKKPSFRHDGSYRIFHITKKSREDSEDDTDDDQDNPLSNQVQQIDDRKTKSQKRSLKNAHRNGFDEFKRKSAKNKRLLFLHKSSCESTSIDMKTPTSSRLLTNDLSSSIISNDASANQTLKTNKQIDHIDSCESDVLVEEIGQTIHHNDATLNDLLARADQLETTVKKPEFSRVQPSTRTSIQQRRKRFIIASSTVLIIVTLIITIVVFVIIMILRYKTATHPSSKSSSSYGV